MPTPLPIPDPTPASKPPLIVFVWRYFSGAHLDGRPRTNATWFRKGTAPAHHVNWWAAKPRFHRAVWRWAVILVPIGAIAAYAFAPVVKMNLAVLLFLAVFPYCLHHVSWKVIRLIPRTRVVYVNDDITAGDISEHDEMVTRPILLTPFGRNPLDDDTVQDELDRSVSAMEENDNGESAPPRKRRSS